MSDFESRPPRGDRPDRGERGGDRGERGGDRGDRGERGGPRGSGGRRPRQTYCPDGPCYDYKDVEALRRNMTDMGRIKPRRQTGNCARCQRQLAVAIKRARHLALLPFVVAEAE